MSDLNNDDQIKSLSLIIEDMKQRVTYLESQVARYEENLLNSSSQQTTEDDIDLYYPNVESWVTKEFTQIYAKAVGGDFRWCVRWWDHTEALLRFEALWRAWERMRLDPAFGMAHWYRDYFDISLTMIVGPRGPFARCSPERHEASRSLPTVPAPVGFWDTRSIADDYPMVDLEFNNPFKHK